MDCEAGLKTIAQPIYTPRQTMGTDMDVVLAYNKLKKESKHTIRGQWVMGHTDIKKKDKPDTITLTEKENIECDAEADDEIKNNTPATFKPLPGYKAMLQLDGQ